MATTDDLRVGDSEREAVADELREHYAQGRLTIEEFQRRLDAAFAARTRGELDRLIADLPHAKPAGAPLPSAWVSRHHGGGGPHFGPGGFGPGERRRARFGRFTSLLAAVASLIIVFVFMAGLSLKLPGQLGALLAIFAVLRGLFRWIFRTARRLLFR
jgi:Domain of unknown function (DUF1707)